MCALVTGVQTCALPIWIWPKRISCLFCNYIGRLRVLKKLLLAATAAAVFAGPVNAALFTVSGGAAITPLDSDNNFKTDLEALGFDRSEEHTSELQSLMRISYAVFCLKKKNKKNIKSNK